MPLIGSLLQAFIDVEKDLTERETPMDRLICGDVGFGKTEVALRAILCVVSSGKQAMVLVPTIVLAKQHFDVISERFSRYPNIRVGLLSRFQVIPMSCRKLLFLPVEEFDYTLDDCNLQYMNNMFSNTKVKTEV